MKVRSITALAAVAAVAMAIPASAGAEEPLTCKLVNAAYTKVTHDPGPFMYCIDDPQPSPI